MPNDRPMKIDCLLTGSADCPLIRMYRLVPGEAARLHGAVSALASGDLGAVAVQELAEAEAEPGCHLILRSGSRDRGLVGGEAPDTYECILTPAAWDNVAGLLEPFLRGERGHQWLVTLGEANWLLSDDGSW